MSLLSAVANIALPGSGTMLKVFDGIKSGAGNAVEWVTKSATHILIVLLAAALAWGWLGHHGEAKWKKHAASLEVARKADARTWAEADRLNHKTIGDLIATLNDQTRTIQGWAAAADGRQKVAQEALRAAQARGAQAEAVAQRMEADRSGGPLCRTSKAILDGKGSL